MLTVLTGLGVGLSLIIAIGAQNVFVLRQGLRREHVLPVVLVCALSDAILIVAGVAGLGFLIQTAPWLVVVARWAGAAFLVVYGLLAAKRAWRPSGDALLVGDPEQGTAAPVPSPDGSARVSSRDGSGSLPSPSGSAPGRQGGTATAARTRLAPVLLTVLALTWLNPHVYLDTVLMLGSVAATHGDGRWLFAAGAIAASALWFTALGFGARYLGRWLRTPRAWRILDGAIAVVMIALGISLLLPVL